VLTLKLRFAALIIVLLSLASCGGGGHGVAAALRSTSGGDQPATSASASPSPSVVPSPTDTASTTASPTPDSRTWSGTYGDAKLDLTVSPATPSSTSDVTFSYHIKIAAGHELSSWSLDAGDGQHVWRTTLEEAGCPQPPSTPTPPYEATHSYQARFAPGHYKPRLNFSFVTCNADGSTTSGPDGSVEGDFVVQ
jgi:hypothetical protein